MPRTPSSSDAFAAIAEPRRRDLLGALASGAGELDVTALVTTLGWPQPQVSKHLSVLRDVGLVSVVRHGRRRLYSINGAELRSVYDWVRQYERFWDAQLIRLKRRAEAAQRSALISNSHPARKEHP